MTSNRLWPMCVLAQRCSKLFVATGWVAVALTTGLAHAVDLDLELELGVGTTDNINRAPDTVDDPALDEDLANVGINLTLSQQSARSDVQLRAIATYVDYIDGTYDSEVLPSLDATALFRLTNQAVRWFFQGNIGQESVDPFQPISPDNREDIVYLTTGPSLLVPLNSRFSVGLDGWYSDVNYEIQDLDNSRTGARLAFIRSLRPSRSLSLNITSERTEFDLDEVYETSDRYQAFFSLETEGARNELTVDLGWSRSERGDSEFDEPLVDVEWRRSISPATSMTFNAGTRISDSSDDFRGEQQAADNIGGVHNQQATDDPYKREYASLAFASDLQRTQVSMSMGVNKESYEDENSLDRKGLQGRLELTRQLGNSWSASAYGEINNYEYENLDRDDDGTSFGLSLYWQRFRTLEFELRGERHEQDSSDETATYTENRLYLILRYIPDFG